MEDQEIGDSLRRWLHQQKRKWRDVRASRTQEQGASTGVLNPVPEVLGVSNPQPKENPNKFVKGGSRLAFNRVVPDAPPVRSNTANDPSRSPGAAWTRNDTPYTMGGPSQFPMILSFRPSKMQSPHTTHGGSGIIHLPGMSVEPNSFWHRARGWNGDPPNAPSFLLRNSAVETTPEALRNYWTHKQVRVKQEFVNRLTCQLEANLKTIPSGRGTGGLDGPFPHLSNYTSSHYTDPRPMPRLSDILQPPRKLQKRSNGPVLVDTQTVGQQDSGSEAEAATMVDGVEDPADAEGLNLLLSLAT